MYHGAVFHLPILEIEFADVTVDCFVLNLPWSKKEINLSSHPTVFLLGSVWFNCGGLQRWIPCPPTFHGHRAVFPVLGKVASSTRRIYKKGKEPEYSETRLGAIWMLFGNIQHFLTVWENMLLFTVT